MNFSHFTENVTNFVKKSKCMWCNKFKMSSMFLPVHARRRGRGNFEICISVKVCEDRGRWKYVPRDHCQGVK